MNSKAFLAYLIKQYFVYSKFWFY